VYKVNKKTQLSKLSTKYEMTDGNLMLEIQLLMHCMFTSSTLVGPKHCFVAMLMTNIGVDNFETPKML